MRTLSSDAAQGRDNGRAVVPLPSLEQDAVYQEATVAGGGFVLGILPPSCDWIVVFGLAQGQFSGQNWLAGV